MPVSDRERSRGAISVEYALMLVLVSGVVLSGLGFALRDSLWEFTRCFQGELIGAGCDGSTLPAEAPGASGSADPANPLPSPCEDPNAESSPTTPPSDASTPDPTPSDCPTPTAAP
jgi:hypothetical protein